MAEIIVFILMIIIPMIMIFFTKDEYGDPKMIYIVGWFFFIIIFFTSYRYLYLKEVCINKEIVEIGGHSPRGRYTVRYKDRTLGTEYMPIVGQIVEKCVLVDKWF